MNFFICNRYDSKKEDIHIITPEIPIDKNKIKYYNYEYLKKLSKLKTNNISNSENAKNISQNLEDNSDELQIIEYPYQTQHNNYNLNTFYSNKSNSNSSFTDNNIGFFNCFNSSKNNNDCFYENKLNKNLNKMKNTFSCKSNSNTENSIINQKKNKIRNKINFDNTDMDLEDTIKGEDNINISKLKIRNKNIKTKKQINNLKNIPNRIKNNKNKSHFKHILMQYGDLNVNKFATQNDNNINKNIIITQSKKNLNKSITKSPSPSKQKNKSTNKSFSNKNIKKNLIINKIKDDSSINTDYITNNCFCKSRNNIINKSHNDKNHLLIHKNSGKNNFFINDYKQKESFNSKYINDIINDNKSIIKRKIKNDFFHHKMSQNEDFKKIRKK